MLQKWNINADGIMMWFALLVNLVTSCLPCTLCAWVHGAHAQCKNSSSKYPSGLVCMQDVSNLGKLTTSYFQELNTRNANENMPNMIPHSISQQDHDALQ